MLSLAGATLLYALVQLSITWLVCNSIMLWIFKDPFTARSIQKTHCNKYVHLSLLVLCAVVPIIPVVIIFELGGFAAVGFPPLLCTPRDPEAAYYSIILPTSITSGIGSTILSYMLWIIYKVQSASMLLGTYIDFDLFVCSITRQYWRRQQTHELDQEWCSRG